MPQPVAVGWEKQYRIISSQYPPINFFEGLTEPDLMEELFAIEAETNDRLRDQVGDIHLVAEGDRVSGPGSSVVMASFTHISSDAPSRFSDGTYGVYYAAKTLETAIAETRYHREKFMAYTNEDACVLDMRVYIGEIEKPLHDIRDGYNELHDPDHWGQAQTFGREMRDQDSWGIVYRSVRNPSGECIAVLRPKAVSIPVQGPHLSYEWDGHEITVVYEKKLLHS